MNDSWVSVLKMGRFPAHFFVTCLSLLLLGGCTPSGSPYWSTVAEILPHFGNTNVSDAARQNPYASIDLTIGGHGGLVILAGEDNGLTFWQTGGDKVLVLDHGAVQSMAGLLPRLEMNVQTTRGGDPVLLTALGNHQQFHVVRSWRDAEGGRHSAAAQADWQCDVALTRVKLPLTTQSLHKCTETLTWADGTQTKSVYWRDVSGHVWMANVVAWPGAAEIHWQVARPWWPLK